MIRTVELRSAKLLPIDLRFAVIPPDGHWWIIRVIVQSYHAKVGIRYRQAVKNSAAMATILLVDEVFRNI